MVQSRSSNDDRVQPSFVAVAGVTNMDSCASSEHRSGGRATS
jgi:hypothetical protein